MMGPPDDHARTAVNSDIDQTCVIEVPDDTETVDETESELSPSSPEAMLREVANDATAIIEYVHRFPRAFCQPHVEAAFQAQYTETRLTYVACVSVGMFFFYFVVCTVDLLRTIFDLGSQPPLVLPLRLRLGLCTIFLVACLGLLCNQTKLRHHHNVMRALSNITFVVLLLLGTGFSLGVVLRGEWLHEFAAGYLSGLVVGCGTFVLAHTGASLWTFIFNAVFAASVCCAVATMASDSIYLVIATTVASAIIMGSISQQILLQHRHSFAAKVRHQLRYTFHAF